MTEDLGSKLGHRFRKCKKPHISIVDGNDSDFEIETKKSRKSQYFDSRKSITTMKTLSKNVGGKNMDKATRAGNPCKTRVRKKSSKDSDLELQTSKKLTKVMNNLKANLSVVVSSNENPSDNSLNLNKRRRNKRKTGEYGGVDIKKIKQVDNFNQSDNSSMVPKSVEKVELKDFSRTEKEKYPQPKKLKSKPPKNRSSANAGCSDSCQNIHKSESDKDDDDNDEEENEDWEEVNDVGNANRAPRRPIQAVEVVVQKTKGKKTPEEQMQDEIRCAINRMRVTVQKYCHQVHLLCYVAIGLYYNKLCNDSELQALALSHVPPKFADSLILTWKTETLSNFISWFHRHFPCSKTQEKNPYCHGNSTELMQNLKIRFEGQIAKSTFEHTLMVIIILRVLGFSARLVHSFEPISSKPDDLLKKSSKPFDFSKIRKIATETSKTTSKMHQRTIRKTSKNSLQKREKKENCSNDDKKIDDKATGSNVGDDEDGKFDWWTEVYLPEEKRWIYVNSHKCILDDFNDARNNIRKPFSYVIAWQNDGHVKDLTSRYDSDWLLVSSRKRVDPDWWKTTLAFFKSSQSDDDVEDQLIEDELFKQPLPSSISAYKNHPLYVLGRHLLKFECIYPPTSLVLGYIKNEPVYSRECVHLLHSKEKWMVEGRVLKDGEEPYKVVKRRPKVNKKAKTPGADTENLDLFGRWQTEQFVPRPAVGGIVPKNEFGNVEIFKPWMLPPGTVFIEEAMPGLNRVAKKLDIDVAPAMLGWEFHRNVSAPILRGWVVCTEHEEILRLAWNEEQRYIREKELEKRQERALKNWKKLAKALLIRENLKEKCNKKNSPKKRNVKQPKTTWTIKNMKEALSIPAIAGNMEDNDINCTDNDAGDICDYKQNNINLEYKVESDHIGGGGGFILSDEDSHDEGDSTV